MSTASSRRIRRGKGRRRRSLRAAGGLALGLWQQPFILRFFSRQLARPPNGFGAFACAFLRGLLVSPALFHFTKETFALHFLRQHAKRLLDIVVANQYLHETSDPEFEGRAADGAAARDARASVETTAAAGKRDYLWKCAGILLVRPSNDPVTLP